MITALFGTLIPVTLSALGLHGHHDSRVVVCDRCGVENTVVLATVTRMQTSPRWRERHNAAHALRRFDWRCHPEAVGALAYSLLNDRSEEVREEAAQSLTRMAPCLPVAHAALEQAARSDPDHATRRWARKALAAMGNRCEGACQVCAPSLVGEAPLTIDAGVELVVPGTPGVPAKVIPQGIEPGLELQRPALEPSVPSSGVQEPPAETLEPLESLPLVPPGSSTEATSSRTERPRVEKTAAREKRRPRPFFLRLPALILER